VEQGPEIFGRYEIVRALGSGGMGEILLARQRGLPGLDRLVVLKKVLPHLAREPGFIERFLDEMRVSMLLTHGNIVQVYDVGQQDGQYYMAMEWVEGLDLREVLARMDRLGRTMPEEVVLFVLSEVAKGLAYAHARRDPSGRPLAIVHRDVSPANILLSNDGQVKITDFGVAVATARLSFSMPGTLHGKVAYMSPEQIEGADLDGRSDQFSLAVVGYEMLASERPFDAENDVAILDLVRRCEPKPLLEVCPWLDPMLARIVMRAMSRDPDDRFATMDEFAAALNDYCFKTGKVLSARDVAEFMGTLGSAAPERDSMDLDSAARRLLADQDAPAAGPATLQARAPAAAPEPRESPRDEEPRFRARQVLAAILLLAGVAGGMWALGRFTAGPPEGGPVPVPEPEVFAARIPDVAPIADSGSSEPEVAAFAESAPDDASEPPAFERRVVHVRSVPEKAEVYLGSRRLGETPLPVTITRPSPLRLTLRMRDHESADLMIGPDSPSSVEVQLPAVPSGRVRFRFFPANARVWLDDEPVQVRGNLVDRRLLAGEHVITVAGGSGEGPRKTLRFRVQADQVVELGTIEVPLDH